MSNLFDESSLAMIPTAYKEDKLYSLRPTDGTGDFAFSRGSNLAATRVGADGLIEKGRENLLLQSNQFDTTYWPKSGASVTSGQAGYDGSNDAWLLEKNAANGRVFQNLASNGVQTFSVYAKAATNDWAYLLVNGGVNSSAWFDLSTGSLGSSAGGVISKNIISIGNGWYKISITFNETISRVRIYVGDANNDNSGTSGSIYIQDAQLEIGLAATEVIESGATKGKAGLLENTPRLDYSGGATCPSILLEPLRTQLVTQSEYINSWSKAGSVTISSNNDTSPEGVQNASLILPNAVSGSFGIINLMSKSSSSITYTFSGFAKAKGYNFLILRIDSGAGNGVKGAFDLSDGTISTAFSTNGTGFTFIDADIKPYGNNWYRYEVAFTTDSLSVLRPIFYVSNVTGNGFSVPSYTANGTDGILFWGAQCETGSYPTSYIPTMGSAVTRSGDISTASLNASSTGSFYVSLGKVQDPYFSVLGESFAANSTRNDIAVAYSPTELKISLNGAIVVSATGTYDTSSLTSVQLGHYNGADQLGEGVKELNMFNGFLTDTELNALTV